MPFDKYLKPTLAPALPGAFVLEEKMDKDKLRAWIKELIDKDELWRFYKCKDWIKLKTKVLEDAHHECSICRQQGKITRYDIDDQGNERLLSTVHHVQYVRKYPELALSMTYTYQGKTYPNLIPVCKACHNKLHSDKGGSNKKIEHYTNTERW